MSRRKRDHVEETLYGPFRGNAPRDRKALYETMFMRTLLELATNRFKWTNLPSEIDRRFLEIELARHALVVFFHDEGYERYFALRGSAAGGWNMYDNPTVFSAYGNSMMSRPRLVAGRDCIPIWSNTLRTPDWDMLMLQASKLAEIERTIEINLLAMRHPYLFAVDDSERVTFQNIWSQIQEGQPAIFGTPTAMGDIDAKIKKFDLGIDKDLVLNLQVAKSKIWNETMTYMGINNSNQDKRERLVADEVAANDSQISAARNSVMGARKYACELINAKYDLDIQVEWNEDQTIEPPTGGGESMRMTLPNNSSTENTL